MALMKDLADMQFEGGSELIVYFVDLLVVSLDMESHLCDMGIMLHALADKGHKVEKKAPVLSANSNVFGAFHITSTGRYHVRSDNSHSVCSQT